MDAWDRDRRRSGGAGWILDDSGDWVSTSAEPEVPAAVAQALSAPERRGPSRAWSFLRGLLVVLVVPGLAATATLYVWKGPGAEIVLTRIEPLILAVEEARARMAVTEPQTAAAPETAVPDGPVARSIVPLQADVAPAFESHAPADLPDCAAVRRGMGNGIVFHRTGGCPD